MLELCGVSKTYGEHVALGPIDLRCPARRTTVLLGPSGCGKSTLLRLVAGLIFPDAGLVRFDGAALEAATLRQSRLRLGYVIQEGGLFPHMTVRANVTLMARHLRWESARSEARLRQLAELTRLPAALFERYPAELSGGQRQRVSLMRALMLDPDLLLLDEPLGALDPLVRYDLQQDLRAIFRQLGKTVLLVTHDIGEAAFFGDHVVLLRDGRIVQQGRWADFVRAPAEPFVERFLRAQRGPSEPFEVVA